MGGDEPLKKFKVTYVTNTKTIEMVVEAESEDDIWGINVENDPRILSKTEIEHDDGGITEIKEI